MEYTKKQKEIIDFLESLVGQRYNLKTLIKDLSLKFQERIIAEIVNDNDDSNGCTDFNIMFNSTNEDTFGYFDIYFLKMKNKGHDGSDFYITEVAYEFE